MKKIAGIIVKVLLGLILLILVLLFTIPIVFKEKIKTKVEKVINESVNATVKFEDYKLGFFKNFPNLSFSLTGVSVVGTGKFEGDTLAGFKSFDLVFNLASLMKSKGYEVRSIVLDQASINVIYLKDGSANYDIMKETTETEPEITDTTSSDLRVQLKKVAILNSFISYTDESSAMRAVIGNLNFNLSGDMTMSKTDLQISVNAGELTFIMDGMKYLNKSVLVAEMDLLADLDKYKFTFGKNYLTLNDLKVNFSGMVAMPGDDIETDIQFSTPQTSFKTLLSLVPAVYMTDYKDLTAGGEFVLNGYAKGIYSDADSTLPDVALALSVNNGLISYPALPEKIKNINIKSDLFMDGKVMDKTTVNVDLFHMELAGNPFDMTFALKTPMSDPDFKGSMKGKIDLTALTRAVPLDSISLSGIIEMSVKMAGKLSMIEKEQYDKFEASGTMGIKNMLVAMTGYPEVRINDAEFNFTPAFASANAFLNVGGKSDIKLTGRLENYIPYVFKDETIKGSLALKSDLIDVSEILSKMEEDTTAVEDTSSLTLIRVPENIDFDFNAIINNFIYDNIKAQNVKGHIIVRNGILSFRETGMNILGGLITMNADYDTRDSLKPVMKADFDIQNLGIKDAFTTFNTIQKLAPAAEGVEGKMNMQFSYQSLLGSDMMPLISSIIGGGKIQSDAVTLVKSAAFDKMKEVLKLGDNYSNTFKNLNASFKIIDGRIFVSPFDAKVGNIKMNIGGDQGLDQTMNYIIKTEIPRSDLGSSVNSLIDNLSAQASAYGITYKPADLIKVNIKVTGVFGKPVVTPVFGSTAGESSGGIKETAKETVKQTVTNAVDTGKDKLRQEAESRGDKLIKEAEEKGRQLQDEAAKAADKIRAEAEINAQKLITEASTKGTIAKLGAQKGADAVRKEADKKATQLTNEADIQANKLVEEAKTKKQELINKI
ncbi:MAG: AsmA family protein [Bacteroidales bacterium]|jgi:hypothetical protein|nr:AsmA family protein [Bacteroidales bacterium]